MTVPSARARAGPGCDPACERNPSAVLSCFSDLLALGGPARSTHGSAWSRVSSQLDHFSVRPSARLGAAGKSVVLNPARHRPRRCGGWPAFVDYPGTDL